MNILGSIEYEVKPYNYAKYTAIKYIVEHGDNSYEVTLERKNDNINILDSYNFKGITIDRDYSIKAIDEKFPIILLAVQLVKFIRGHKDG